MTHRALERFSCLGKGEEGVVPRVTIVLLNWNDSDETLACLRSLRQLDYPSYDVVVVDNGSSDGSVRAIREQFPGATVVELGHNVGFTGGNNAGLRLALERQADYALLLNNDTDVTAGFLRLLVKASECDPAVGIAGPTIYYYDQPEVVWSAGGRIDWRLGRTGMVGLNEQDAGQFGEDPREVDFLTGCALLVKATVLQQVGLLDERFFIYYEDAEWCVRARRAGFKIVHVPQAHIWHKISPQAREASPRVHYLMTRNRLLFLRATKAGLNAWLHTLFGDYARTLTSWSLRPKWRTKRRVRRAMWHGIVDFALGRFGLGSNSA